MLGGWLFEDQIFFSTDRCPSQNKNIIAEGNILFADSGQCRFEKEESDRYTVVKLITRMDGSIVYRLLAKKNSPQGI